MPFRLPSGDTVKWIGDLSLQDAEILTQFGLHTQRILEFGSGGSTQIFAQCKPDEIISIETDPAWITLTQQRLDQISDKTDVKFISYDLYPGFVNGKTFDLILVDGIDYLRRDFAINSWKLLEVDGFMIFHDTKRFQDFQNASWVAQLYHNEIKQIDVNARCCNGKSSNMTILHKKSHEPYENWNYTENKPLWAYGMPGQPTDMSLWSPGQ
jgi:spermidine synthase